MDAKTMEIREAVWRERLKECNGSGLSRRAWREANGIADTSYYYWQRKLRGKMAVRLEAQESEEPTFAQIALARPRQSEQEELVEEAPITIVWGAARIEIRETASAKLIGNLLWGMSANAG